MMVDPMRRILAALAVLALATSRQVAAWQFAHRFPATGFLTLAQAHKLGVV